MPALLRVQPRCALGPGRDARWSESGDVEVCNDTRVKMVSARKLPSRRLEPRARPAKLMRARRVPLVAERSRSAQVFGSAMRARARKQGADSENLASLRRPVIYRSGVRPHLASATLDPLPILEGEGAGPRQRTGMHRGSHGPVVVITRVARVKPGRSTYAIRKARAAKKIARRQGRGGKHAKVTARARVRTRQP